MYFKYLSGKLTRDKIVTRSSSQGGNAECRILTDQEFLRELKKKFLEEALEVVASKDRDEAKSELADLQEVMLHVIKAWDLTQEEIEACRLQKVSDRGSFEQKMYCDYIVAPRGTWIGDYCAQHPEKYPVLLERHLIKPLQLTDPDARKDFNQIKAELFKTFPAQFVSIVHIGSTSIPTMLGQPTIDILAEVESLLDFDLEVNKLRAAGWICYGEDGTPNRRTFGLFNKDHKTLIAQLFCFEHQDPHVTQYSNFNRQCTQDAVLREKYIALKNALLAQPEMTYEHYNQNKAAFIQINSGTDR